MSTITMSVGASGAYAEIQAQSGTLYQADANGNIANVASGDVTSLMHAGALPVYGMGTHRINVLDLAYNNDGSSLAATAVSGRFGKSITLGTSSYLVSFAANSTTVTSVVWLIDKFPTNYIQNTPFTCALNGGYILGSGTIGTHTINANLYVENDNGSMSADLIGVAAKALPVTTAGNGTDILFSGINSSLVIPGGKFILQITTVHQDTAGSNIFAVVNSARFY